MSSWRSSPTSERLAVARVIGPKGLTGGLRVEPLTDWPEHLDVGARVYVEGEEATREIVAVERDRRVPVLVLSGIASREAAEALTGRYLETQALDLPAGSYYWHQLEGLVVLDEQGAELGTVVEIFRAGENEVYRIEGEAGELLVPALRDVVRDIDLEAGRMIVRYLAEEVR